MSLSSSTRRRRHHCGQPLLHHLSLLPWTQKRKSETNFYKIKCFGLCFALFAHIFLPFEEEKRKATNGKSTNTWIDGWLDGRIVVITPKKVHSKEKTNQEDCIRTSAAQSCISLALYYAALNYSSNYGIDQPTDRPTTRLTAYLSCSFQCIGLLSSQNLNRASVC